MFDAATEILPGATLYQVQIAVTSSPIAPVVDTVTMERAEKPVTLTESRFTKTSWHSCRWNWR